MLSAYETYLDEQKHISPREMYNASLASNVQLAIENAEDMYNVARPAVDNGANG